MADSGVPSLSALRSQLRKGPIAKAPPTAAKTPAAKRPAPQGTEEESPAKKLVTNDRTAVPAKTGIAKTPSKAPVGKSPGAIGKSPGAIGKTAGAIPKAPPKGTIAKAAVPKTTPAVAKPVIEKQPATGPGLSAKGASPAAPPDGAAPVGAIPKAASAEDARGNRAVAEFVASVEAAADTAAKLRHLSKLAEAMSKSLQMDQINFFLRVMKKKIVERAQGEGVKVNVKASGSKAPPPSAAVPEKASPVNTAASVDTDPPAVPQRQPPTNTATAILPKVSVPKVARSAKSAPTPAPAPVVEAPPAAAPAVPTSPAASPDLSNEDPVYVLIGSLGESPAHKDGVLQGERVGEIFKKMWDGVASKSKDWVKVWQSMTLPVDLQAGAITKLIEVALAAGEDGPEKVSSVAADLVKAHKVKMRSVEDVLVQYGSNLDALLSQNEEAWQIYASFLVHVFPKPATEKWGWSRVGWSWASWWQFVEKCIATLDPSRAFDVVSSILKQCQEKEGNAIGQVQLWLEGEKLDKVLTKLGQLGDCDRAEVHERLGLQGVEAEHA